MKFKNSGYLKLSNHFEVIVKDIDKVKLRGFHIYGVALSNPFLIVIK
jgi:hypothetical protein